MRPELRRIQQDLIKFHLMPEGDLSRFLQAPTSRDVAPDQFVNSLVERGTLSPFQAKALLQGKAEGLVLGNYLLIEKIGEGGMGKVYKARHLALHRIVALKLLPAMVAESKIALERFHQEMRGMAQLSHPHIVAAYDAGEVRGIPFLAMEYVAGTNLDDLVRSRGPLELPLVLRVMSQAAALEHAHARGIIHRDVKPSNLMLDQDGTLKLLDLGLARLKAGASPGEPGLTRTGMIFGTVDYMAHEQALDTRTADARTDVYALGCTVHFLVTGREIYPADTVLKIILAHREAAVPALREIRPETPPALDAAYARMVAKDPADRFQSMIEVRRALDSIRVAPARKAAVAQACRANAAVVTQLESRKLVAAVPQRHSDHTVVLTHESTVDSIPERRTIDVEERLRRLHLAKMAMMVVVALVVGMAGWRFTRTAVPTATTEDNGATRAREPIVASPSNEPVPTVQGERQINLAD